MDEWKVYLKVRGLLPRGHVAQTNLSGWRLSMIVLLPMGICQTLSYLILPATDGFYRQGARESLSGGLVTRPIWLICLWLVVCESPITSTSRAERLQTGPSTLYGAVTVIGPLVASRVAVLLLYSRIS